MLTKLRRQRSASAAQSAAGILPVAINPTIRSVLDKLGAHWRCGPAEAADRVITLALTGWKPQHGDIIDRLSVFVPGADEPFRRACMMLRNHFDAAEAEMGEAVRDCDRIAWLEMLLESLKSMRLDHKSARLADLLAGSGDGTNLVSDRGDRG